ncbi:MAG TPA: hypothetical protein VF829_01215 [Candidatus Paceibacterota bacterium]
MEDVTDDLQKSLPSLLSKAVAWAEEQEALILEKGKPLDSSEMKIAQAVGVRILNWFECWRFRRFLCQRMTN